MQFSIIRSNRRTMSISVRSDGEIVVRVPYFTGDREIRDFTEMNRTWIEKQLRKAYAMEEQKAQTQTLSEAELKKLAAEAKKDFPPRVAHYAKVIGVSYGRITIRNQKSKWGSCSSKGNLNFNCLLMLAPESIRNYVVVHELCHRKQMNHSPAFWAEVRRAMPDYENAKNWIRENGTSLMLRNPN